MIYQVATGLWEDFVRQVDALLDTGWKPQGGVSIAIGTERKGSGGDYYDEEYQMYAQAFVKEEE